LSVVLSSTLPQAVNVTASGFVRQFGRNVRLIRERRALSQEALADAAGLHRTHISLIERGQRSARLETIQSLARALNVQPAELMPTIRIRWR
jgi:transcriptional regulator with XRE-family HTH domain